MSRRGCWDHRPDRAAIRRLQSWSATTVPDVALALAISREGPGDWSPEATLWLYALADSHQDLVCRHLVNGTLYAAARAGILPAPDALACAVEDAMALVRRPGRKSCPSIRRRGLELRMRADDFGFLRSTAERLLLTAIRRGITNYLRAFEQEEIGRESLAPTNRQTGNHGPETLAA